MIKVLSSVFTYTICQSSTEQRRWKKNHKILWKKINEQQQNETYGVLIIIHCQWSSQKRKTLNLKIIYLPCWSTIRWILSNWFPKIMDEMFQMSKTSGWLPWMFHPSNFVISATILKNARGHYSSINVAIINL